MMSTAIAQLDRSVLSPNNQPMSGVAVQEVTLREERLVTMNMTTVDNSLFRITTTEVERQRYAAAGQ